jgi:hypothetical protein
MSCSEKQAKKCHKKYPKEHDFCNEDGIIRYTIYDAIPCPHCKKMKKYRAK